MMNQPVLVLNANYEPLNVCSTKRALGLILTGKAEMLLNGRGYVRTVSEAFPRPSVIRLGYMIKRPRARVRLTKREILRRDNHTCQYCGRTARNLTIDHVLPRQYGGTRSWTNLVAACPDCNRRKGGRTPQAAQMQLLRRPFEPRATAAYLYAPHLKHNADWREWVAGW